MKKLTDQIIQFYRKNLDYERFTLCSKIRRDEQENSERDYTSGEAASSEQLSSPFRHSYIALALARYFRVRPNGFESKRETFRSLE